MSALKKETVSRLIEAIDRLADIRAVICGMYACLGHEVKASIEALTRPWSDPLRALRWGRPSTGTEPQARYNPRALLAALLAFIRCGAAKARFHIHLSFLCGP